MPGPQCSATRPRASAEDAEEDAAAHAAAVEHVDAAAASAAAPVVDVIAASMKAAARSSMLIGC